jgi:hypothetical protein
MNQDAEHLRLLSIFHYIVGGLAALFSLFPLLYTTVGAIFIFVGWIFAVIGSLLFLLGIAIAICILIAGRSLETHSLLVRIRYGLHRTPLHSLRNNSWRIHDYRPFTRIGEDVIFNYCWRARNDGFLAIVAR